MSGARGFSLHTPWSLKENRNEPGIFSKLSKQCLKHTGGIDGQDSIDKKIVTYQDAPISTGQPNV